MTNPSYYQESGHVNYTGILITMLATLMLSCILGYLYVVLTVFVPFPYLNFFFAVGVGLVMGMVLRILFKLTHNRSLKSRITMSIVSGLLVCYFQWATYIQYLLNGEFPSPQEFLSGEFINLWQYDVAGILQLIYNTGSWSIFGVQFRGLPLGIVWLLEALIFLYMPFNAARSMPVYPYSEVMNKWYPKFTLTNDFESVGAGSNFVKQVLEDPLGAIQSLGLGEAFRHIKIHLFVQPNEETQYLVVEKIFVEDRGSGKRTATPLIKNLSIPGKDAEQILKHFEHKAERLDVF